MSSKKTRVCIIGAGPCGVSALFRFVQSSNVPELVCYEKQSTWAGLWNYSWRTGTDEYGEPCHAGMYRNLWSNGPKECLEFPDYTFEEHFGKNIPSFPPREVLRDYLEGRWTNKAKCDLKQFIKFNNVVQSVQFNKSTDDFTVSVRNLKENETSVETFTHVIVANGIFNAPKKPNFYGLDTFEGRVLHAHDFRDAREFKGQRILLIGASYSAEDLAMQCSKFGAKHVISTWRSKPMDFKWPNGVEERPLVQRFDEHKAYFKDGTSAELDAVILCTGYLYSFPFMENDLRLKSSLTVFPDNLYKGLLWLNGGNSKVFYMGTQDQYFTFTLFDVQAIWIVKYILGQLQNEPSPGEAMRKDVNKWRAREATLEGWAGDIPFQADYIVDLCQITGYECAALAVRDQFLEWEHDKHVDVCTYRDKSFTSNFTNSKAPLHTPWMQAMDSSIAVFVKK